MKLGEKVDFDLAKAYEFRVTVKGESGHFSAELKLSPTAITIRISGDEEAERRWGYAPYELASMECFGFNMNFLLFNLHFVKGGNYWVGENLKKISHFEAEYTAEYVIASKARIPSLELHSIHLFCPTLEKWVGYTEKQQEIVENQVSGSRVGLHASFDDFDFSEFCAGNDNSIVSVNYNLSAKASPLEFEVGVRFPPSFGLFLPNRVLPLEAMRLYQKAYAFLSLLHGHELSMDRIELWEESPRSDSEAYLYYPKRALAKYELSSYSWFPLSHKLRYDTLGLPAFPLDSIVKYFSGEYEHVEKWIKYIKYRRMRNPEDRFLGYFRLLESLTKISKNYLDPELLNKQVIRIENIMARIFGDRKAVKSFLRGIERYNNSKYNTANCFRDFYAKLPQELVKKWSLGKDSIEPICKLRNDISHANNFFENNDDLLAKCSFVESLLLIALLETLDISIATTTKMIVRLPGASRFSGS